MWSRAKTCTRAASMFSSGSGVRDVGKKKTPGRVSSGRYSSMIKGYVKGARNVKPFLRLESTRSGSPERR
jgi:hypothetical protein